MTPTHPPPELLDREQARRAIQPALDVAVPLLQEAINYALCRFKECAPKQAESAAHLAILLPFRHLIELVDGVQVQVAEACPAPAKLQLRAAFETVMTLEYTTRADSERRCYAYLTGNVLTQIGNCRRLQNAPESRMPGDALVQTVANLNGLLARPGFRDAHREFEAVKHAIENGR